MRQPYSRLASGVWIAFVLGGVALLPAKASERPNFLLMIADDLTWSDLGYEGNREVHTPNLDRLCQQGMRLRGMYSPATTCSPSRHALYTGLFPVRSGAFPNHTRVYEGTESIFTLLKEAGYRVALQNKTHVGPPSSFPYEHLRGADDLTATEAFLRRDRDQPWLLVYASNDPHGPWTRGPQDRYDPAKLTVPRYLHDNSTTRKLLAAYYAEITQLDTQVGNLLSLLDDTGQSANTLVMFVSEQGSSFPYGGKWSVYDNGIRVSTLVRWPGKIRPGSSSDALVQYVDVAPTFLAAAGIDPAAVNVGCPDAQGQTGFDGRSFLDVLTGTVETFRDCVFAQHTTVGIIGYQEPYPMRAVRDARYKLILNLAAENTYSIAGIHKGQPLESWQEDAKADAALAARVQWLFQRPAEELYDLEDDPEETKNLADDPAYQSIKVRLRGQLDRWMAQQGDQGLATEVIAKSRQGGGRQAEPKTPRGKTAPAKKKANQVAVFAPVSHSVGAEGKPGPKPESPTASAKVTMRTAWGERVTPENAWQEYPRPAMARENWTNLNGLWDYAVVDRHVDSAPSDWDGKILVPFAIESPLSGVERRIAPDEAIWYRRTLQAEKREGKRTLLNFEAVDYQTTVWINGVEVGRNTGGNLPFSFDITDALQPGKNTLTVRATDATDSPGAYQLHGKQVLEPGGIWYTPVSGIWQTVWLEEVPATHLTSLHIVTKMDGTISLRLQTNQPILDAPVAVKALLNGRVVTQATGAADELALRIPDPQRWSPDSPTLYDLEISVGDDVVKSYAGLRETGIARDAQGHLRLTLNGQPIFHWGTLDQGWWPDGLLTPPSDEAMASDIQFLKAAGFNTIRKHIKVEPRRYYYHCDRLGMMMWQDQVSSGTGKRRGGESSSAVWTRLKPDPVDAVWPDAAHRQFMAELKGMIDTLHNHPCIVQWVPFNEAWGQHRTMEVGRWMVAYDPTRQVNIASGGNWYPVGHIVDHHQYPHPAFPFELGADGRFEGYVKVMGEFGGHGFPVEGHLWNPGTRNWGYGGLPKDKAEWLERYRESIRLLAELQQQGIAAGIYTQTTDVEGEINGLLTYDRRVQKIAAQDLAKIHEVLFRRP